MMRVKMDKHGRYDFDEGYTPPPEPLPEASPPPPPEPCQHVFSETKVVRTKYGDDLCDMVIEYGRQGFFIEGFSGRFNICVNSICHWLSNPRDYPKFDSAIKVAISACIHYWMEELQYHIEARDWTAVTQIKMILADLIKSTPKQLRENMYNNLNQKSAEEIEEEQKSEEEKDLLKAMTGGK